MSPAGGRAAGDRSGPDPPGPRPRETDLGPPGDPPEGWFGRPAGAVARDLLGLLLVSDAGDRRTAGRVVETEAYPGPEDPASHAAASVGRTERNDPMFGPPGTAYVHVNYGIHRCLNVVVDREGHPAAVLIRALEPVEGLEVMRRRRGHEELTSGPGRLTEALGIGLDHQRHPLTEPPLRLLDDGARVPEDAVDRTPRVGISRAVDAELRWLDARSRWVSRR